MAEFVGFVDTECEYYRVKKANV